MADDGLLPVPDDLEFGPTIRGFLAGQQVFGRFTLREIVGRGGMGLVWTALDEHLQEEIALKFLPELVRLDAISLEELKRETRRSRKLSHTNIVKVYDLVSDTTSAAISMEYVHGATLSGLRAKRENLCFDVDEIRDWLRQLLNALAYAHDDAKIVHRDLKPANVMVDETGKVKVTDFGISSSISESVTRVTVQRGASGTLVYMSPQQAQGEPPAVTDDIYSLGATIYELLTGKPPFYSGDVAGQIRDKLPPPMAARRAAFGIEGAPIPAEWEETVAACLAKNPADRPRSMAEVAERLGFGTVGTGDTRRATEVRAPLIAPPTTTISPPPPPPTAPAGIPATIASPSPERKPEKSHGLFVIRALLGICGLLLLCILAYFGWNYWSATQAAQAKSDRIAAALEAASLREKQAETTVNALVSPPTPQNGQPWRNSLGMTFVPAGTPGVLFSVYDTRKDDYQAFVNATGRTWPGPDFPQAGDHPAVNLDWDDAKAFCAWLTDKERREGKIGPNQTYRLPTDAEWSKAVGLNESPGGTPAGKSDKIPGVYPWGTQWPPPVEAGNYYRNDDGGPNLSNVIPGTDGFAYTSPVGCFNANSYGLYDMGGNVWQWCEDFGDANQRGHVQRGGSYDENTDSLLSSHREWDNDAPGPYNGFRCVLDLTGASTASATPAPAPTPAPPPPPAFPMPGLPWTNSLGVKFVPAGSNGVLFSVWDVRVKDYQAFVNETGHEWPKPNFTQTENDPAVMVSWDDAHAFCDWLTKKEQATGKLKPDQSYRLPTDVEWSKAVGLIETSEGTPKDRAGKFKDNYPWGTPRSSPSGPWPPPQGAGNYCGEEMKSTYPNLTFILGYNDGYVETSPVGSFNANQYGLYDMGGNVSQWCEDWYDANQKTRVFRGGSWGDSDPMRILSSFRGYDSPEIGSGAVGFRVVVVVDSSAQSVAPPPATSAENTAPAPALPPAPAPTPAPAPAAAYPQPGQPWTNSLGEKFVPAGTDGVFPRSQVALGNGLVGGSFAALFAEACSKDVPSEAQLRQQLRSQVQLGNEGNLPVIPSLSLTRVAGSARVARTTRCPGGRRPQEAAHKADASSAASCASTEVSVSAPRQQVVGATHARAPAHRILICPKTTPPHGTAFAQVRAWKAPPPPFRRRSRIRFHRATPAPRRRTGPDGACGWASPVS